MSKNSLLMIVRELVRGHLQIIKETTEDGTRIVIVAERAMAILAVILIMVAIATLV